MWSTDLPVRTLPNNLQMMTLEPNNNIECHDKMRSAESC